MKLGRQIPLRTARKGGYFLVQRQDGTIQATVDLGAYFDETAAPLLPESVDWTPKAMDSIKRVYGNDHEGCCVISSAYHETGVWSANETGTPVLASDAEVHSMYQTICGRGDNGCDISRVLAYTRDTGLPFNGTTHKIEAFISVDNRNQNLCKAALAIFGSLKLGTALPQAWYDAPNNGEWGVTNSRSIGGHDIPAFGYSAKGVLIATWGGLRTILWDAFLTNRYIDECYCPLSKDWYTDGVAPSGIDAATLKADLDLIKNGQVPSIGEPSVPISWLI